MAKENLNIDIDHVAQFAGIELSAEEKPRYQAQLSNLLKHFEVIQGVSMENLETPLTLHNVWQADQAEEPLSVEKALSNAPEAQNGQIKVLKVVE